MQPPPLPAGIGDSLQSEDSDLLTNYPDDIKLRWRGSETGPYKWGAVMQMFENRQIGSSHEVFWLGEWIRFREMKNRVEADRRTLAERQQARIAEKQRQAEAYRIQVEKEQRHQQELDIKRIESEETARRDKLAHEVRLAEIEQEKVRIKAEATVKGRGRSSASEPVAAVFGVLILAAIALLIWYYNPFMSLDKVENLVKTGIEQKLAGTPEALGARLSSIKLRRTARNQYSGSVTITLPKGDSRSEEIVVEVDGNKVEWHPKSR